MIERNDPMLNAADEIIDSREMMVIAVDNREKFRESPEFNLDLLDHRQVLSLRKMSKRRKKIFLASLTHYDPLTGKIGTTRFGQNHKWRMIPPVHIYKEKTGAPLEAMMNQWMELLNYD